MTSEHSICKAGLWALSVCMILSLQGYVADAQTNCTTTTPGWGVALLVLAAIILAVLLCLLCAVPFFCKNKCNTCQSGFSFSK